MQYHADSPRRTLTGLALSTLAITATFSTGAYAEAGPDQTSAGTAKGTFNVLLENDYFGATDRHYTNGIQLSYLSAPRRAFWLPDGNEHAEVRFGWQLGQSIFTPDDTETPAPLPNQRPYAAWLYAGLSMVYSTPDTIDSYSLNVGTVGPDARGEQVQNGVHEWLANDAVRGWDNQLDNETGAQLIVERKWRALAQTQVMRFGVDIMPHIGLAVGNLESYANAGFSLRIGNDLDNDFGPPRIRPSLPGTSYFVPHDNFAWYLFAGADGRYVAENQFLEGDGPVNSTIRKKEWVGDIQAGFVITQRSFRLAYTLVHRTREFENQPEPDRFGSLALTWRF